MNADDWSNLLPQFWHITDKLDSIRDETLENSIPDLYELIKHTRP